MENMKTIDRQNGTFNFKLEGTEKVWKLPLLSCLPISAVKKLRGVETGDDNAALDAVCDIVERYCPGLTDTVGIGELGEITRLWYEASGITLGES